MRTLRVFLILLAMTVVMAGRSEASLIMIANLTNAGETPPTVPTTSGGQPRPASFGTAMFVLNDAMTAMTFTATIFNIDFGPATGTPAQTADVNDNLGNAHIHAGNTFTPTWPVVWGFIGAPFNDNAPNDVVVTPFATGVGGTVSGKWDLNEGNNTTLTAQLPNILAGRSYINFHTTQFPGGEIRGQITVPEPGTIALFGLAAAGLVARRRQRQR